MCVNYLVPGWYVIVIFTTNYNKSIASRKIVINLANAESEIFRHKSVTLCFSTNVGFWFLFRTRFISLKSVTFGPH